MTVTKLLEIYDFVESPDSGIWFVRHKESGRVCLYNEGKLVRQTGKKPLFCWEQASKKQRQIAFTIWRYLNLNNKFVLSGYKTSVTIIDDCTAKCNYAIEEKGEENMNTDFRNTLEGRQQSYLTDRADSEYYNTERRLQNTFGLTDDKEPKTANELIKRITEGKYVVSKDNGDYHCYNPMDYIRWRDPAKVTDLAGYETAMEKVKAMLKDTKDAIICGTPETALAKIKEIEVYNG